MGSPRAPEGGSKFGREGEPVWDGGTSHATWKVAVVGDVKGEVVRKGARGR